MLTEDNLKIIMGSKLNVKKVNPSCLFVGAIPSYEPSDMFEDSLPRSGEEKIPSATGDRAKQSRVEKLC